MSSASLTVRSDMDPKLLRGLRVVRMSLRKELKAGSDRRRIDDLREIVKRYESLLRHTAGIGKTKPAATDFAACKAPFGSFKPLASRK